MTEENFPSSLARLFEAFGLIDEALTNDLLPRDLVFSQARDLCSAFAEAYPPIGVEIQEKPSGLALAFCFKNLSVQQIAALLRPSPLITGMDEKTVNVLTAKKEIDPHATSFAFAAEIPEEGRYFFTVRQREQGSVLSSEIGAFLPPLTLAVQFLSLLVTESPQSLDSFDKTILMISLLFDSDKRKYDLLSRFNPYFGV